MLVSYSAFRPPMHAKPASEPVTVVATLMSSDVEDSTALAVRLGAPGVSVLWATHDAAARALLAQWRGREIDKSDGFLLMFDRSEDALAYAQAYHQLLAQLEPPLKARVGLHRGTLVCRTASPQMVAEGAKPLELDGAAKATTARLMALARGGQTLLSEAVMKALPPHAPVRPLGHWRLKGLDDPLLLFEPLDPAGQTSGPPPADHDKAYRVLWQAGQWRPAFDNGHTLPAERDAFIGRHGPLQALARRLDEGHRLVSVLGPGGSGKTRLALRHAHGWRGDYAGGAWWCDLTAARSLDGLVHAVAQGLNLPLGKEDPVHRIGQALASRGQALVLLDNFEQVVDLAEATLGHWLAAAPDTRFIVTSRETLQITGEATLWLDPMSDEEGLAMFQARTQARAQGLPGASLPPGAGAPAEPLARQDLLSLVHLLDGLPLAIELAAARTGTLSPGQLLPLLKDRFAVLKRTGRRPLDRQATLLATLDWSWGLLRPAERAALVQMAVFEGGCDLAAALAVLAAPGAAAGAPPEPDDPLDLLERLVHQSMLKADGDGRYSLLPTIRDYALHQQQATGCVPDPQLAEGRFRHAQHYAATTEAGLIGSGFRDSQNILAAALACAGGPDRDLAVRALQAAWLVVHRRGPLALGQRLAQQLDEAGGLSPPQQAQVLWVLASAWIAMGHYAQAKPALARGLALADSLEQPALLAMMQAKWADVLGFEGQTDQALYCATAALATAQATGDAEAICMTGNALGALQWETGDPAAALATFTAALVPASQLASPRWRAGLLGNVAMIEHQTEQLDQARLHYQQAIDLAESCGERRWANNARCNLGLMLCEAKELDKAQALLECALQSTRELGNQAEHAVVLCNLGILCAERADNVTAARLIDDAIRLAKKNLDLRNAAQFEEHLAKLRNQ